MGSAHPFIKCSNGDLVLRDGDFASGLFQLTLTAASLPRGTQVAFFFYELCRLGWCGRAGGRSTETVSVCSPDRSSDLSEDHE